MNVNWSKTLELSERTLQLLPEGTCLECGGEGFVQTDVAPNRVWVGYYLGRGEWIDVYTHEICPKCHGTGEIQYSSQVLSFCPATQQLQLKRKLKWKLPKSYSAKSLIN